MPDASGPPAGTRAAAQTGTQTGTLARCVGDPDWFLAERWGRRPHHHRSADLAGLLSLADVDHLVATSGLRAPAFRLVKHGQALPPSAYTRTATVGSQPISDLADVGRVHEHFADGATIVLQGLQRWWPPLADFCRGLEGELTHPVQANAYVTPPVAQGLELHRDRHDVFAIQTHGRKHWVAHEAEDETESETEPESHRPTLDVELVPGDCLYVPKGVRHAARTVEEASVHVTIGVRHVTWADVSRDALDRAAEEVGLHPDLPAGFAHPGSDLPVRVADHLRALADRIAGLDADELADRARRRFWAGRQPSLDGQLRQLLDLDRVVDHTVLRRRPGAVCHLAVGADVATLTLGDRQLRMPAALAPAIRHAIGREQFTVGDLGGEHTGDLDENGRLTLARRLVREGLLVTDG